MDLAKIIDDLKVELQCLDTAIASMEELARVQSLSDPGVRPAAVPPTPAPETMPTSDQPPPVKRGRGRPRKDSSITSPDPTQSMSPNSGLAEDDSGTATA